MDKELFMEFPNNFGPWVVVEHKAPLLFSLPFHTQLLFYIMEQNVRK